MIKLTFQVIDRDVVDEELARLQVKEDLVDDVRVIEHEEEEEEEDQKEPTTEDELLKDESGDNPDVLYDPGSDVLYDPSFVPDFAASDQDEDDEDEDNVEVSNHIITISVADPDPFHFAQPDPFHKTDPGSKKIAKIM